MLSFLDNRTSFVHVDVQLPNREIINENRKTPSCKGREEKNNDWYYIIVYFVGVDNMWLLFFRRFLDKKYNPLFFIYLFMIQIWN